jgi:hypothetical protein
LHVLQERRHWSRGTTSSQEAADFDPTSMG